MQRDRDGHLGWGTGPFDNDTAADFANALDDAEPEACETLIRGVLIRTIDAIHLATARGEGARAVTGRGEVRLSFLVVGELLDRANPAQRIRRAGLASPR
ncbi:DUF4259 domain-containing protein [Streptomyces sp. OK228]|uniref:DUF4259 domain-containing protein n=1 Tax=Streptomyces sp. OK228 TaxID=1882786 RepID=UPI00359C1D0E